ncbi:aminodeoxychorismate/anthranilate synthase component II [bacterium]|nr:aminodeoxychorismate/anthranilate synthase component II [bacterium]
MTVLMIDNFDSFTYNLVDEFAKRGARVLVYRASVSLADLEAVIADEAPDLMVISPGPSTPGKAGVGLEAVRALAGRLPIFGVCLGHQVIIEAFGGRVGRAPLPVHGKASPVTHEGRGLFAGLESPMAVGRYHSLVGLEIPAELEVTARCGKLVMALAHKTLPLVGVQFHPESILTPTGGLLIENALAWARDWAAARGGTA